MKNKIQKFSKGNFRTGRPEVIFEETNLVLIIGEGEVYRGSFIIKSENEHVIRGLVYPSSFRVKLKDSGFEGNPARVEFTYDGRGSVVQGCEEGGTPHVHTADHESNGIDPKSPGGHFQ